MKTKPFFPKAWQIPGLLSGEITRVIVPIKCLTADDHPVNVGMYHPMRFDKDGEAYPAAETYGVWGYDWDQPAPYQPGDVLAGKEAWTYGDYQVDARGPRAEIVYKVTNDARPDGISCLDFGAAKWFDVSQEIAEKFKERCDYLDVMGGRYNTAITMPAWAVRLHLRVLTVEAGIAKDIVTDLLNREVPVFNEWCIAAFQARYTADHGPDAWDGWAWSVKVERVDTGIPASLERA